MKAIGLAVLCAAAVLAAASPALAGDDPPAWLKQAAAAPVPAYEKGVDAVVVVDDAKTTVAADGRTTTVARYAVRVLTREGRDEAFRRVSYVPDSSKVREIKAWLLRDGGPSKAYGK